MGGQTERRILVHGLLFALGISLVTYGRVVPLPGVLALVPITVGMGFVLAGLTGAARTILGPVDDR